MWFRILDLEDRVTLLAEPDTPLPPSLVAKIVRDHGPVVTSTTWVNNPQDEQEWHLAPMLAAELTRRRDQLLIWWDMLSAEHRALFVEHRNERLPDGYAAVVVGAFGVGTTVNEADSVEFTPIARDFLEWKARELAT
ncbi:hypothetical protein BOX37_03470 [Nocardia mangyaensis]|uniref:Uncharacterized protein n=2 Tax=Nocardia mangyaensis TaxID=2213200 RepID=A0A1J0VMC8_9NOCA|nr:hypothetical protein BOX37_03470 [Nocardia mangyaensis]